MPFVQSEPLYPPKYLINGHLETIVPSIFRKVKGVDYNRIRLETPDEDFVDVDTLKNSNRKAVILSHGLEGGSDRQYIMGMAKIFYEHGWDVFAWNCRSCSGEMNRQLRLYHHGDIEDLKMVVQWVLDSDNYDEVVMAGFSMGGSLTVRFAGEYGENIDPRIKKVIAFSVPTDLAGCSAELDKPSNILYKRKFLKKLAEKIRLKDEQFPGKVGVEKLDDIKLLRDFDEFFTAPLHGYGGASDFYEKASSGPFIKHIRTKALIVNALNDPFLPEECYPYEDFKGLDNVFFETPIKGGHVGFLERKSEYSWAEKRALAFAES
ncbi:MAG: alpha/beta fold hydrolase [Bacteroidota bacterium]